MWTILKVLRFGLPFMRRYWSRLTAGILLGVLFAMSNAMFVWVTKTVFARLSPAIGAPVAGRPPLAGTQFLTDLNQQVLQLLDPWLPLMGRALDWRQIVGGLLLLPTPMLLRGVLSYLSNYCMSWVSERMINDLRVAVLTKLSSLSLDFFNRSTMGNLVRHIHGDTAALHLCLMRGLADLIKEPITLLSLIAAACVLDWQLTLVAVVFLAVSAVPMRLLGKKAHRAAHGGITASISQTSLLVEALSGIRIIKAFGLEAEQIERFREYSRQLIHHGMKGVQARELIHPIVETASMLGLGALVVWIVHTGRNTTDMVGLLTAIMLLNGPVKKLASVHIYFSEASAGVDRLANILREQPTVKEPERPVPVPAFSRELRFEHVSFTYGHQLVVEDIHLTIPCGAKIGIAGESGSGKSTLVNLLFRFYDPTAGRITWDGIDLRDFTLHELRQQLALVSQEIVLFDKTVAENIALGRPGATRTEIEAAARAANAHDFICQLPHGYETRIGERGVTLSGGQRQRLSIARAFIRNAPILVLDEATAALDSQAETEVQAAIDRLTENRTVISIAHRLSTLRNSTWIIVLSQGHVVEQGSFDELLSRGGVFTAMAMRQGIAGANPGSV